MRKTGLPYAVLLTIVVMAGASCSRQAETAPGRQTTCPVMKGKPVNPDIYIDVDGKRIFACCPGCIVTIKADPEKYISEMEAEGVILEDAPE